MVIAETSVLEGTQHEIKESCETKCWMCGKICAYKSCMGRHEGKTKIKCDMCGKRFI